MLTTIKHHPCSSTVVRLIPAKAERGGPSDGDDRCPARMRDLHLVSVAMSVGRCVFGVLSTGKKFTNDFAIHFTVTAGKIVRYHMYENSHAISAAFPA